MPPEWSTCHLPGALNHCSIAGSWRKCSGVAWISICCLGSKCPATLNRHRIFLERRLRWFDIHAPSQPIRVKKHRVRIDFPNLGVLSSLGTLRQRLACVRPNEMRANPRPREQWGAVGLGVAPMRRAINCIRGRKEPPRFLYTKGKRHLTQTPFTTGERKSWKVARIVTCRNRCSSHRFP